jgi:methionyl-tRNA formyltransferase
MKPLRVVVMCCDGIFQRHLAMRAAEEFSLAGIVIHSTLAPPDSLVSKLNRYINPEVLARHLLARVLLRRYEHEARPLVARLFDRDGRPPVMPSGVPHIATHDVNAPEVTRFIRDCAPDIVLVNGTNLLREPLLALLPQIPLGIINLHTGLSPYSRGGNCNLYMLLEGHPEKVGVTVHHIDRGIDSGDIIFTSQVSMEPEDSMEMIDARSFHLGIDLLLRAAHQLQQGSAARVKQWEEGKLFLKRTGYVYEPYHRLLVNRALERGLLRDYLEHRQSRDAGIRLVKESGS